MSSSSNKDYSKSENNSDSDYEMSKDDSNERGSSDQTSNDNRYKEEEARERIIELLESRDAVTIEQAIQIWETEELEEQIALMSSSDDDDD